MIISQQSFRKRLIGSMVVCLIILFTFSVAAFTAEKVTLTYIHDHEVEPGIITAFEITHPYIKIDAQELPFRKFFETIEVKLTGRSETPDAFEVDVPLNTSYAVRGFTLPLDDYIAKYADLADLEDFFSVPLEASTYKGQLYSLPRESSAQFLYYNIDIFDKYGVEPPEAAIEKRWTWEKIVEAAKKLTIDEGSDGSIDIWGFAFDQVDRPYQLLPLPQSLEQPMIAPDQLTATDYVDSPKSIQAGKFYYDLYNTWQIAPKGLTAGQTVDTFGAGKIALLVGGTWNVNHYERNYPDLNFDVAPHPYFEGGKIATPTGAWHIGVNPNSKYKDEAALFVIYLVSRFGAVLTYELRGHMPVRESTYKLYENHFSKHPWNIARYESQNTAVPRVLTPGYLEWELIFTKAYADIRGGVKPETALSRATKEMDRQLRKYKALMK